eukprot:COSAG01_NODE_9_length_43729_cov_66.133463_15_plen_181_part_00
MTRFFPVKEYLSILKEIFVPTLIKRSVEEIDLQDLVEQGYKFLFLDIDNTVLALTERKISLKYLHWIEQAKVLGLQVYFVSNNSNQKRIESACTQAKLKAIYFSCKPFVYATKELMRAIGAKPKEVIMVGDQLFTDVIMGNWLGACSVLVDPLDKKLSFFKTLQRQLELSIVASLSRVKS